MIFLHTKYFLEFALLEIIDSILCEIASKPAEDLIFLLATITNFGIKKK